MFTDFPISTHAPLAGRDERKFSVVVFDLCISTHAPLAGRDAKGVEAAI